MARRKNIPATIYWLQDIRPATIAVWVQGLPFYVGKTILDVAERLAAHRHVAATRPHGRVGPRILECGEHVRIVTLETVSVEGDWCARERHWIATSRRMFPDVMTNVLDGGGGTVANGHWEQEWEAKWAAYTQWVEQREKNAPRQN
jgi:hypothetical protein